MLPTDDQIVAAIAAKPTKFEKVAALAKLKGFRLDRGNARNGTVGKPSGYMLWIHGTWSHSTTLDQVLKKIENGRHR